MTMDLQHEKYIIQVSDNGDIWCFDKKTMKMAIHINAVKGLTEEQIIDAVNEADSLRNLGRKKK